MNARTPEAGSSDEARRQRFDPALDPATLKRQSVRGGLWVGLARGGTHIVRLGATLVLARLLAPEDFGLLAMIISAIGVANVLQDLGLSVATIQRRNLTQEQVSSLFWLNASFGAVLALVCSALAPVMVLFYGDDRAFLVTIAVSLSFLLKGLGTQHLALMHRMMQLADVAKLHVQAVAVSAAAAVALALNDFGYWALVAFVLIGDLVTSLLAWNYCRWRPQRPAFDQSTLEMVSFGGYMVGFSVLGFLGRNVHNILIGRLYGVAEVGLYSRAYALLLVMQQYTSSGPGAVVLPALSRITDQPLRFRNYYLKALRIMTLTSAPIAVFSSMHPHDIIHVLFGGQWDRSADVLRWLAPLILLHPVPYSSGWLFMSRGKPRDMFVWGVFGWAAAIACIIVGSPFGLEGIAIGYAAGIAVIIIPCMIYATRGTAITLGDIGRAWIPGAGAATVAALLTYPILMWTSELPALLRLGINGVGFVATYMLLCATVFGQRRLLLDLIRQLRSQRTNTASRT